MIVLFGVSGATSAKYGASLIDQLMYDGNGIFHASQIDRVVVVSHQ
jgi:hypothetical protein